MKHPSRRNPWPLVGVVMVIAAGAAGWHYYRHGERMGACAPLDQAAHTQIAVLSPASEELAESLPTNTTSHAIIGAPTGPAVSTTAAPSPADAAPIILTSATVITAPAAPAPATTDPEATKRLNFGLALNLLSQAYAIGGPQVVTMLDSLAPLVPANLKPQVDDLRAATPAEGALTVRQLLVEAQRVRDQGPPAAADATPTWLQKLVKITNLDHSSAPAWPAAAQDLMGRLAANQTADAARLLAGAPLNTDKRYDALRARLKAYQAQSAALNALFAGYLKELP